MTRCKTKILPAIEYGYSIYIVTVNKIKMFKNKVLKTFQRKQKTVTGSWMGGPCETHGRRQMHTGFTGQ